MGELEQHFMYHNHGQHLEIESDHNQTSTIICTKYKHHYWHEYMSHLR